MVLLSDSDNAIWTGGDVSAVDVMQFAMLTSDQWRDDCLIAVDKGQIDELTELFCASMTKRRVNKTIEAVLDWVKPREGATDREEITESLPPPSYWWETAVDTLASEYGWEESYIIWNLPYERAHGYLKAAAARKSGKDTRSSAFSDDQAANMLKALQKAQEAREDGTQSKA